MDEPHQENRGVPEAALLATPGRVVQVVELPHTAGRRAELLHPARQLGREVTARAVGGGVEHVAGRPAADGRAARVGPDSAIEGKAVPARNQARRQVWVRSWQRSQHCAARQHAGGQRAVERALAPDPEAVPLRLPQSRQESAKGAPRLGCDRAVVRLALGIAHTPGELGPIFRRGDEKPGVVEKVVELSHRGGEEPGLISVHRLQPGGWHGRFVETPLHHLPAGAARSACETLGIPHHENEIMGQLDAVVAVGGGGETRDLVVGGDARLPPCSAEELEVEQRLLAPADLEQRALDPVAVSDPGPVVWVLERPGMNGLRADVRTQETEKRIQQIIRALVAGGQRGASPPCLPIGAGLPKQIAQPRQCGLCARDSGLQALGRRGPDHEERGRGPLAGAQPPEAGLELPIRQAQLDV